MDTRIEMTIEKLKTNGWEIQPCLEKLDWWIDEAFELKSTWNPVGTRIYFTLDVDPQATFIRRKGELIISVSVSKSIQKARLSTDQVTFYFSELDGKGIEKLITTANGLRNEIKSEFLI